MRLGRTARFNWNDPCIDSCPFALGLEMILEAHLVSDLLNPYHSRMIALDDLDEVCHHLERIASLAPSVEHDGITLGGRPAGYDGIPVRVELLAVPHVDSGSYIEVI